MLHNYFLPPKIKNDSILHRRCHTEECSKHFCFERGAYVCAEWFFPVVWLNVSPCSLWPLQVKKKKKKKKKGLALWCSLLYDFQYIKMNHHCPKQSLTETQEVNITHTYTYRFISQVSHHHYTCILTTIRSIELQYKLRWANAQSTRIQNWNI